MSSFESEGWLVGLEWEQLARMLEVQAVLWRGHDGWNLSYSAMGNLVYKCQVHAALGTPLSTSNQDLMQKLNIDWWISDSLKHTELFPCMVCKCQKYTTRRRKDLGEESVPLKHRLCTSCASEKGQYKDSAIFSRDESDNPWADMDEN